MTDIFTPEEIATMSAEIDKQLEELKTDLLSDTITKDGKKLSSLPPKQRQNIEKNIKENSENFSDRVLRALYNDLCKDDGILYKQYQRFGELNNKEIIKTLGPLLAGMGLASIPLQTVTVAITVYVLHIGVKVICDETQNNS
jgi:hypothetical protein